jgi:hypothetical protein
MDKEELQQEILLRFEEIEKVFASHYKAGG